MGNIQQLAMVFGRELASSWKRFPRMERACWKCDGG
ncbi:hypothetical protein EVA_10261 [gut metagenome]|uniref:Uncharacterized protein n=1 Tax=gut metagenome TaxID=749906 RepID=J9CNF3_9ZZZZ